MSNTVRVFLGTRLECAQCHDHPFDKWTQLDYYQMAALSHDMQSNYRSRIQTNLQGMRNRYSRKRGPEQAALRTAFQEVMRPLRYTSIQEGKVPLRLPDDYQYDNANPNQLIDPATMFGEEINAGTGQSTLKAYADWLTSKENPRFTTVIANRLWKEVMGLGLIEPVDEMTDETEASNPELMAFLEEQMRSMEYDLKGYLRMLYKTDLYARAATKEEIFAGQEYHFQGPLLQRMSAEQIWDSFVTLINPAPDTRPPAVEQQMEQRLDMVHKIHDSIYALETEEFVEGVKQVASSAADGAQRARELTGLIAEARKKKDVDEVRRLSREANQFRGNVREKVREHVYEEGWKKLVASGEAAREFGPEAASQPMAGGGRNEMMSMSMGRRGADRFSREERRAEFERYQNLAAELGITDKREQREFVEFMSKMITQAQRAANLPSPAPNGHFLREFGQSDRDVIENASDEAALPQILEFLNGPYAEAMVSKHGVLARSVMKEKTAQGRLNVIFLSLYSRYPTAEEIEYMKPQLQEHGDEVFKDLVYAILNTQQFIFIQ